MKILVQQQELLETLEIVSRAISSSPQLPILGSVLISADEKTVNISATDLYFGICTTINAQIENSGTIAIPGKDFKKIISSLGREIITIEKINKSTVEIKSKNSTFSIQIIDESEFPDFPQKPTNNFLISVKDLELIAKLVVKSASNDQTRPILTTILLSQKENSCCAVCTDGFRLSKLELPPILGNNEQLLIPAKTISEVIRVAQKQELNNIEIASSNETKQAVFTVGKYLFYVRLIEGEFPPYQKIIPSDISTTAVVGVDELLKNLKRTALLTDKQQSITQLIINKKNVEIKAKSSNIGTYQSTVDGVNTTGDDISIAFNTQYILDFLLAIEETVGVDSQVKLECAGPTKPALFSSLSIAKFIYVVMPFRVV